MGERSEAGRETWKEEMSDARSIFGRSFYPVKF